MAPERIDYSLMMGARAAERAQRERRDHGLTVRINKRRLAAVAAAADVVQHVPAEGEAFHGIMTGFYDLMHLLIALLRRLGCPCRSLRIATLCLSARNVQELCTLLDSGTVGAAPVLVSGFFRRQEKAVFSELLLELSRRGQKVAVAASHCKIITLDMEDGRRFTLEGSANLRTNRSLEQFALIHHAELHDHYATWLDGMIAKHEVREGNTEAPS